MRFKRLHDLVYPDILRTSLRTQRTGGAEKKCVALGQIPDTQPAQLKDFIWFVNMDQFGNRAGSGASPALVTEFKRFRSACGYKFLIE